MNDTLNSSPAAGSLPQSSHAMSRRRAALLHFLLSVAIFSAVIIPLLMLWYPPPLFFADGGWNVIQITAGVDIVIGPLLTLVVFKSGKKNLRLDLAAIALLQFCALGWGVHLMYQERPLFLAFAEDRFGTVTARQIFDSTRPLEQLLALGNDTPVRVLVGLPEDPRERLKIKLMLLKQSRSLFSQADRYEAITPQNLRFIDGQSLDMNALLRNSPQYRGTYDAFMQKAGAGPDDLDFFPLMCRYNNLILVLRRADGSIAGSLDIPPPDLKRSPNSGTKKTGAS